MTHTKTRRNTAWTFCPRFTSPPALWRKCCLWADKGGRVRSPIWLLPRVPAAQLSDQKMLSLTNDLFFKIHMLCFMLSPPSHIFKISILFLKCFLNHLATYVCVYTYTFFNISPLLFNCFIPILHFKDLCNCFTSFVMAYNHYPLTLSFSYFYALFFSLSSYF